MDPPRTPVSVFQLGDLWFARLPLAQGGEECPYCDDGLIPHNTNQTLRAVEVRMLEHNDEKLHDLTSMTENTVVEKNKQQQRVIENNCRPSHVAFSIHSEYHYSYINKLFILLP